MYTTSRYAPVKTREVAKKLAKDNNELYIARGKKTIEQLVEFARKKGEEKINVVEGNETATIEIDELGRWKWVSK